VTEPRRLFWLLARAQRRTAARADAGLADLGLTATQAGALFCIGEDGLLVGELAEALDLAQSAASGLASRLEEAGLARRETDARDGRAARLVLTPLGRRRREEAAKRTQQANAALLAGFSEQEIDVVVRWLQRAADADTKPTRQKQEGKAST
jgi:DNA-binding MarR family transcriptional regulator